MTLGELAMFFRKNLPETAKLKLAISELDAWPRRLFFTQCALRWVAPSPNIPDPETALLYVGMCLFEGTNLNEGRGTETPFRLVGAPWLDAASIAARISAELRPGCSLEAVTYTPKSIPGKARSPRYRDETCPGVHIMIEEPIGVRAFTLAVALLSAIRKQHPNEFAWNESFDVLAGTPDLRRDIERDVSTVEIIKRYAAALEAFDKDRPRRYEVLAQGG
jgi:uncharacterized protein YbbC (DUF1343 family)